VAGEGRLDESLAGKVRGWIQPLVLAPEAGQRRQHQTCFMSRDELKVNASSLPAIQTAGYGATPSVTFQHKDTGMRE
jgi:hypothetical protein